MFVCSLHKVSILVSRESTRFLFFQLHYCCLFCKTFFLFRLQEFGPDWVASDRENYRQTDRQTHRQSTGNFLEALEAFLVLGEKGLFATNQTYQSIYS